MWRYPSYGHWQTYNLTDKILVPFFNLTFLRGFFDQFQFTGIGQGWTLTVEECFYFTAPVLLIFLAKSQAKYTVLAIAALSLIAIGCLLVSVAPHRLGFFASYRFMFYHTFFGRVVEFMLGTGLALFIRKYPNTRPGGWATLTGVFWIMGSVIALSLISTKQLASWDNPFGIALNNLWLPLGIVLFFYGLLTERTWFARLLGHSIAQDLGKSSYAFYLVHMGVLSIFLQQYVTTNIFILFAVAIMVAFALWKWVEEPLNHKLRKAIQ